MWLIDYKPRTSPSGISNLRACGAGAARGLNRRGQARIVGPSEQEERRIVARSALLVVDNRMQTSSPHPSHGTSGSWHLGSLSSGSASSCPDPPRRGRTRCALVTRREGGARRTTGDDSAAAVRPRAARGGAGVAAASMTTRDVPDGDPRAGFTVGGLRNDIAASAAAPPGWRRRVTAVFGVAALLVVGCGEDANDAPGGSAPASNTAATGPAGSAPGPGSPGSGPSPESADEGHPSVPLATPEVAGGD